MTQILIYGANGYSGRLIAGRAAAQGLKPVLAGRNGDEVRAFASSLQLDSRVFGLNNAAELVQAISGFDVVLHCAGPFSATAAPMMNACLEAGVHYVDITGEIDVFELARTKGDCALSKGIRLVPGAGFDVVPTDTVAARLHKALPDATQLTLAFEAGGGTSTGTAKTTVEGLTHGCRARRGGAIVSVPYGWKTLTLRRGSKTRTAMPIPWGDVATAFTTTGIPEIDVFMVAPRATISSARRLRWFRPFLALGPVQSFLKMRAQRPQGGPSEEKRQTSTSYIWGEVRNRRNEAASLEIETPNGYELTAITAVALAMEVARQDRGRSGFLTPTQVMGADWLFTIPGVREVAFRRSALPTDSEDR